MTVAELETSHPAPFSAKVLEAFSEIAAEEAARLDRLFTALDPFAGIGRIHSLPVQTVGVELQHRWARAVPGTLTANALALPFRRRTFDGIFTSPCYGNRMADTYDGERDTCTDCGGSGCSVEGCLADCGVIPDAEHHTPCDRCSGTGLAPSRRVTYTIAHGAPLHPDNAGAMQWGEPYRVLHAAAWREAYRVLRLGGAFVVNISNHIRGGEIQKVAEWHLDTLLRLGLLVVEVRRVNTRRMRHGANHDLRVETEHVLWLRRPEIPDQPQGALDV